MKTEKDYQIRATFRELDKHHLSQAADLFIKSLKKAYRRNKNLSERQMKCLFEIRDSICVEVGEVNKG